LFGGGALGYLMGNRGARQQQPHVAPRQHVYAAPSRQYETARTTGGSNNGATSPSSGGGVRTAYGGTSRR
jgi:hypothetical protein